MFTFKDLLNEEDFERNDTFGGIDNLFSKDLVGFWVKDHHRTKSTFTQMIAMKIVKRFVELVVFDIINNNVEFLFPRKVLSLSIKAKRFTDRSYKYKIETDGYNYVPFIWINPRWVNKIRRVLKPYLMKSARTRLTKESRLGHRYPMRPENLKTWEKAS